VIPENATNITKEMIKQLEIEQRELQKELEIYNSWIYQILFYFVKLVDNIKWKLQKFKNPINNKIASSVISERNVL